MSSSPPLQVGRRNVYVMTATVFGVFTGFAFVIPFLPLYVRQLGVEGEEQVAVWAGVLIGVSPLVAGVLAPFWGRLGDRHGHKRIALLALSTYVVVLLLTATVRDVWELLAARVAIGLFGGIGPLSLAMATAMAPREQTGRAVGMIQAAQILAAALGPLTGGFLADSIGIRATFLVTAALCGTGVFLVGYYYEDTPRLAPDKPSAPGGSFAETLRIPGVLSLLLMLFLVNFIGRSFTPILPLYLQALGVSTERLALSTGLLISVYSVAAAASAAGLGRASRHVSPRLLLLGSLVGGAAIVGPMALVPSFGPLLALGAALGLVSGGALTLCYTMGGLLVSSDRRATAFGFLSAAALFGGSVSPSVAGMLVRWDLRGIFFLDCGLYVVLALALLVGGRGHGRGAPPRS